MKKRIPYILIFVLLAFIALNSVRYFFRIDITTTQANSISQVSKELVRDIEETVFIDYYLSDKLRQKQPSTEQIVDLLNEYAAYARGRIVVNIVDPVTEGISTEVEQLGVRPFQVEITERDQVSVVLVYSGIIIRYLSRLKVIPVATTPSSLEYQFSSIIRQLVSDDENILGILAENRIFSPQNQDIFNTAQEFYRILQEEYTVRVLAPGQSIDPDIDVLLVMDSLTFGDDTAFHVDQFIMRGGNVFFAVDGVRINNDPQTGAFVADTTQTSILSLLEQYGFTIDDVLVLDEKNNSIPIVQQTGGFQFQTPVPYPHWIAIGDTANRDHPITARFAGLDLFWASPLSVDDSLSEYTETLVSTTNDAWLMLDEFSLTPQEDYLFRTNEIETKGSHDIALAFQGPLQYDKSLPIPSTVDPSAVLTEVDAARIIILSDTNVITDLVRATNAGYNLTFAVSALTWLGNDEDLLSIRTRSIRPRTLDNIRDPQTAAILQIIVRWGNMVLIPLIVALIGVFIMIKRRRSTR